MFLVEKGKHSQLTYSIFSAQKSHNDEDILAIQEYIEVNASEKMIASTLAKNAAMAERTFIRRFKNSTGNTPLEYIQRVKVEPPKKLLENDKSPVKGICYNTGYEDKRYFRNLFREYTGLTPVEYNNSSRFRFRLRATS